MNPGLEHNKNPWLEHNKQQMRRDWLATSGPFWAIVIAAVALVTCALVFLL